MAPLHDSAKIGPMVAPSDVSNRARPAVSNAISTSIFSSTSSNVIVSETAVHTLAPRAPFDLLPSFGDNEASDNAVTLPFSGHGIDSFASAHVVTRDPTHGFDSVSGDSEVKSTSGSNPIYGDEWRAFLVILVLGTSIIVTGLGGALLIWLRKRREARQQRNGTLGQPSFQPERNALDAMARLQREQRNFASGLHGALDVQRRPELLPLNELSRTFSERDVHSSHRHSYMTDYMTEHSLDLPPPAIMVGRVPVYTRFEQESQTSPSVHAVVEPGDQSRGNVDQSRA